MVVVLRGGWTSFQNHIVGGLVGRVQRSETVEVCLPYTDFAALAGNPVDNWKMVQRQTSEGTATQRNGGTMGGSKCTNNNRPLWYKWCRLISRPHRLKKTSSKQSKRRVQHLKWLHRETTIIHYNIPFFLSIFSLFCYREMRIHHFPFCPVVSSLHQIKYFFSSIQSKLLVNVCQNRKQYLG